MKKNMIAMILVGGKGTRLKELTKDTAKPAVSFGAKYRLIDFTLSNIANSDIDTVGVVTQYEPYDLMHYIGSGNSWDLDVVEGGIHFLTPFSKKGGVKWQRGTAHAIRQYANFITEYNADHVLILSGDHVYRMDYKKMLASHLEHNADLTVAGTEVPKEEAHRFGIFNVDDDGFATTFTEKPPEPDSTLASMGIYLFNVDVLKKLLLEICGEDDVDFGKNVIPAAINNHMRVHVHGFEGYWRDVGTVDSLYEANMDMLDRPDLLKLNQSADKPVYSRSYNLPPHLVGDRADIRHAVIADGADIQGTVKRSTVGYEVLVEAGAVIEDSVIFPNVRIGRDAVLKRVIVNRNVVIPDGFHLEAKRPTLIDLADMKGGDGDE
jgi:glucose-1-phosphate adenylyltransferase